MSGADEVWARAIERTRADLAALLEFEASRNDPQCPTVVRAVEATFGKELPFFVTPEAGGAIQLRGRIDRVDLHGPDGAKRWVIWDYKTSKGAAKKLIERGIDVQLAVYALAVECLFPGEAVGSDMWGYYRVSRPVGWPNAFAHKVAKDGADNLEQALVAAQESIAERVAGICEGRFPSLPSDDLKPCRLCDFRSACRAFHQTD